MTTPTNDTTGYECVEPEIGRDLWRGALPDATEAERRRREAHLLICDACRLEAAVETAVGHGLAEGSLKLPPLRMVPRGRGALRGWPARLTAVAAMLALAGFLVTAVTPPLPNRGPGIDRSGADDGFLRPVEGETVNLREAEFRWQALPAARSYRLRIEEIGGEFAWEGETAATSLTLPADLALPDARGYRAYLLPVPADAAPVGSINVRFRSGESWKVLAYRAAAAPWIARVLWGLSMVVLAGALVLIGRSRWRSEPAVS